MIVQLSSETRIVAEDGVCYELQRRTVKGAKSKAAGAETWKSLGYYSSLEHACISALVKGLCQGEGVIDVERVVRALRDASDRIAIACAALKAERAAPQKGQAHGVS